MLKFKYLGLFFTFFFLVTSCNKTPVSTSEIVDRTVLVYMAADNSLDEFVDDNIAGMISGMNNSKNTLLVYTDRQSSREAQLWQITAKKGKQLLKTYPDENSASVAVLANVLEDVKAFAPAISYGLVLWSHGGGWWPAEDMYFEGRIATVADHQAVAKRSMMIDGPMTKYFGVDGMDAMDISELSLALPKDRSLEFIMFDACFMAGVEVAYELRNATKWIIAAPAEVMGAGFPYNTITPIFMAHTFQPKSVVDAFMAFYRNYHIGSNPYFSGALSVIDTEHLEELAHSVRTIVQANPDVHLSTSSVQPYEAHRPHVFFDLEHQMELTSLASAQNYADFQKVLAAAAPYVDSTPRIWSVYGGWFSVSRFCGINSYIVGSNSPMIDAAYHQTAWAKAIYDQN